ncbi:MAG: ATPase, partial [Deltaproteobacteria bacterium]|nr:ATPase [Deltaproteobacteria bacterium]
SVTDTGIGLPPEHRERIFDPFYQVQSGICGKTPGLGLGLTLARRIVELHGGKLWAESDGEGSRFHMLLPLIPPVA